MRYFFCPVNASLSLTCQSALESTFSEITILRLPHFMTHDFITSYNSTQNALPHLIIREMQKILLQIEGFRDRDKYLVITLCLIDLDVRLFLWSITQGKVNTLNPEDPIDQSMVLAKTPKDVI